MTSPNLNPLQRLRGLNKSSTNFHDQISNILYGEEYKQWVQDINAGDVVRLVDYLDRALDSLNPASSSFRKCLRELRHICGERMILPTSYTLSSQALDVGRQPVASGGSGDVYEGSLHGSKVCVKRVRVYSKDGPQKATKTLYQEAIVWKRLEHKNIVPLLCITTTPLQLISEWMPGGDLTEYIGKHPDANRLSLLRDIAEGLYFLHSRNIVHGDLKGPNILVDGSGHAQITDFGLARVTQNLDSVRSTVEEQGHTARWTAPEILNEDGSHSKEADVFSFGMVMIEVFTGAVPFNHSLPAAAMLAIMDGKRPPRPTHPAFTNDLCTLMHHCWDQDPHSRPEASWILRALGGKDPPPTKPYLYGIGSSSTLTIKQQPIFAGLPNSAAKYHALSQNTNSTTSRLAPPSVSHGGGGGMHKHKTARPHGGSQTALQDIPPRTGYHPPDGQQQDQPTIGLKISRKNTATSEPSSPLPVDPYPYDYDELRKGRVGKVYDHTGGVGKSHVDVQYTLGNQDGGDISGEDSRLDPSYDFEGNDEGKYWSGKRGGHGASHSGVNLGHGYGQGGQSRNPPRRDLLENSPRDRLAKFGQSQIHVDNSAPRPDLTATSDGHPQRRPSKTRPPETNGSATGNTAYHDLTAGTKSFNESWVIIGNTTKQTGVLTQGMNGDRNTVPESVARKPKKHGTWCRIKKTLGIHKGPH